MKEQLFSHFKSAGLLSGLTGTQLSKFAFACEKSILENPQLDFDDLCIACRTYLNYIIDFPEIDLGQVDHQL